MQCAQMDVLSRLPGLLNLVSSSYIISITQREQVAQIRDRPIFRITDVALIPLKCREDAQRAISDAQSVSRQTTAKDVGLESDDSDVGEDAETSTIGSVDTVDRSVAGSKADPEDEAAALEPPKTGTIQQSTSFVKDVVQDKGKYGRFASRWLARNGSKEGAKRQQGISTDERVGKLTKEQKQQVGQVRTESISKEQRERDDTLSKQKAIDYLTPRILKTARLYFSSSGFYFSYDHDLSSNLTKGISSRSSTVLWRRFEPLFFWNRHLMKPFIEAGQDGVVLPLIQGFVGQRAFSITQTDGNDNDMVAKAFQDPQQVFEMQSMGNDEKLKDQPITKHDFLLTLISRRSVQRAGLRYLRRGIDDDGNVANSVETEQVLSPQDWNEADKTFSLLQLRGSIPLFFSQTPYSFKPLPVIFGSDAANRAAFKKHFSQVSRRYGEVQAISLVDTHGSEAAIGEAYQKQANYLKEHGGVEGKDVGFEWFDFHGVCKGMRFENVSVLLDTLQNRLNSFGWAVSQNNNAVKHQIGILRTNCMDCLDRTNVVQSAVAGRILQQQLSELGLNIDLQTDPKTQWFNTLWADNGDAISKQYAGTSALKGDFTRTRKRNWTGALSDFSLTLNRYYNNIFGDYFLQTNIDYLLGNVGPSVFDEFETNMTSQDYALDMTHVRENAIDTCIKIVLEDPKEDLKAGWTLSCPSKSNTLRALPFEECVLLLTNAALYSCRFNWETEKIRSFERVDLLDIKDVWRGVYITSALGGTHLDESRNVGFALHYVAQEPSPIRTNTRSLSVAEGSDCVKEDVENDERPSQSPRAGESGEERRLLAFKALSPRSVVTKEDKYDLANMSEYDCVKHITDEISNAIRHVWSQGHGKQNPPEVEDRDVISVSDAKKSTGYLESLGYSLKRMVWS